MTYQDSTSFESAAVPVPQRPIAVVPVAGFRCELQCPKLKVWMEMIEDQDSHDAGLALKHHLKDLLNRLSTDLADDDRDKLIEQLGVLSAHAAQAPSPLQLADRLLDFLCECMTDKDLATELRGSYVSNDGDCDVPHLRAAIIEMERVFAPWLDEQSDNLGVVRPSIPEPRKATNRAGRREAVKKGGRAGRANAVA